MKVERFLRLFFVFVLVFSCFGSFISQVGAISADPRELTTTGDRPTSFSVSSYPLSAGLSEPDNVGLINSEILEEANNITSISSNTIVENKNFTWSEGDGTTAIFNGYDPDSPDYNITIRNVLIVGFSIGIWIRHRNTVNFTEGDYVYNITIENVRIENCSGTGIWLTGAKDIIIRNLWIESNSQTDFCPIRADALKDAHIYNNSANLSQTQSVRAFWIGWNPNYEYTVTSGNIIEYNEVIGNLTQSNSHNEDDAGWENIWRYNKIEGFKIGITFSAWYNNQTGIQVYGNTFEDCIIGISYRRVQQDSTKYYVVDNLIYANQFVNVTTSHDWDYGDSELKTKNPIFDITEWQTNFQRLNISGKYRTASNDFTVTLADYSYPLTLNGTSQSTPIQYIFTNGYYAYIDQGNANFVSALGESNKLYLTISASSGIISSTQVYCGDYGKPSTVTGASSWTYNQATKILTVTVVHSSSETIIVEWVVPSSLTQSIRSNYFLVISLISLVPILISVALILGLVKGREELNLETLSGVAILCAGLIIGTILMITILNAFIGL